MRKILGFITIVWLALTVAAVIWLVPAAAGLGHLVKIAFFHIPTAWISVLAFLLAAWWAGRYLRAGDLKYHRLSTRSVRLGLVFCLLATVSGAFFAKLTWGAYWNWDPRQTTIFVLLLIYGAHVVLSASLTDELARARLTSVYALLSFITVPFLVFIIPRFYASLHPTPLLNGSGSLDMDSRMLLVLLMSLLAASGIYAWLLSAPPRLPKAQASPEAKGSEVA
jgi:heme exporter protein C